MFINDRALAALGADPLATEMVFTWSVDEDAAPLQGPEAEYRENSWEYDWVYPP